MSKRTNLKQPKTNADKWAWHRFYFGERNARIMRARITRHYAAMRLMLAVNDEWFDRAWAERARLLSDHIGSTSPKAMTAAEACAIAFEYGQVAAV